MLSVPSGRRSEGSAAVVEVGWRGLLAFQRPCLMHCPWPCVLWSSFLERFREASSGDPCSAACVAKSLEIPKCLCASAVFAQDYSRVTVASFFCKASFASHFGHSLANSFLNFEFFIFGKGRYSATWNKFIWNERTFLFSLPAFLPLFFLPFFLLFLSSSSHPSPFLLSLPSVLHFLLLLYKFCEGENKLLPSEPWCRFLYYNVIMVIGICIISFFLFFF